MAEALRVLLVEDSEDDALLLVRELNRGGYELTFDRVENAEAMRNALIKHPWDLVISDYSMPHFRGTDALKLIRGMGFDAPFIFVSGTIQEDTAVEAMKAGAQDYLMKGNLKRLAPAVRRELADAEVRRQRKQAETDLQVRDARIRALHEINLAITSTLDLPNALAMLLEKIDLMLPYSAATIHLYDKQNASLGPAACGNLDQKEWLSERSQASDDPAKIVCETQAFLVIPNLQADPRVREPGFYQKQGLFSYLGVPLIAKGDVLGALGFYTRAVHNFTEQEVQFLRTLGGQAAIAIQNSQLYEKTKSQAAELEKANEVKSEFLSVMSHELRTPINVMMGYVELVQQGLLGEIKPQQNEALKKSLDHSRNLLGLVSDILQATKIQAQDVELNPSTVNVKRVLEELRMSYELSLKKDLALHWDVPADFPEVETDGNKVKHILQSLIDNAIKFTVEGTVRISARNFPANHKWELQVADTGRGIAADKIPLIFDLFRQLDSSAKRSHEGIGLGLFLAKKHTELLGGELKVHSELGKGSTFTLTLPAR
jgi:signal transduction histidine kinase/CheY-like chemotaxis protein